MADEKTPTTKAAAPKESTVKVTTNDAPESAPVRVQYGALVGDAAIAAGHVNDLTPTILKEDAPAQTTGVAAPEVDVVKVHETFVSMDQVITDPHSPQAVQMPDAGIGSTDLPIHGLGGPTVEEVFAQANADAKS